MTDIGIQEELYHPSFKKKTNKNTNKNRPIFNWLTDNLVVNSTYGCEDFGRVELYVLSPDSQA